MIAELRSVLVHMPSDEYTAEKWSEFGFVGEPRKALAVQQQRAFVALLRGEGAEIEWLDEHTGIQTTSTYDPALVTNEGAVMMRSGRPERWPEIFPMARKLVALDIPIIGWIRGDGRLDAGDTLWIDETTLFVGRSYRSNDEGFRQLRLCLDGIVEEFKQFEMPHWSGPLKVLHLMSVVNLCSPDVALIYPRAMPVRLMAELLARGYRLVECPDEEFDTQGCNCLTVRPGTVIMCAGNQVAGSRLRAAGIDVLEYDGSEISIPRISGPTCNTRPLLRG
jgi:N-dimethylarginine dimethylaminohydrolase